MADWVATVALGKLSDVLGDHEKINVLWALWAPLLLLHLGGPDSITAYSLEDNQLWLRHLLGLVVQLSVAIYVILMSWKNLWFSFMSLPALVAGVIKYSERTWVLMSVSHEIYLHRRPFGSLRDKYPTQGHDYVRVLVVAHENLNYFMADYLEREGLTKWVTYDSVLLHMEANILWEAMEVAMGLMYDMLYTKATLIYSKGGFIMRCISFGCTVSVLVGLTIQTALLKTREEEKWREVDVAITGVLIVGAVALEIYAAIVIFSSNWMMLWLIAQVGETTDDQSPTTKRIRSVLRRKYEEKWNRYRHKTAYSVRPLVYDALSEIFVPFIDARISDNITSQSNEIWRTLHSDTSPSGITGMHLVTEMCYHLEKEWDGGGEDDPSASDSSSWKQNREVSKALSDYMMYLLTMHHSLLPNVGALLNLEEHTLSRRGYHIRNARDVDAACHRLLRSRHISSAIASSLKGKEKPERWEIIKHTWLRILRDLTRGPTESKDVKLDLILADWMAKNHNDDIVQDEVSDKGWQEAFPEVQPVFKWLESFSPTKKVINLAPPGSIEKAMAGHLPKENSNARPISQGSKQTVVPESIEEKLPLVSDEEKKCPVSAEEETKVEGAACVDRSPFGRVEVSSH
ncbi:hypothetical protein RHMOL_Rhmol01G0018500 [Rhododendron molle]|uniref:Uncharacterized protein n=1 Tax=Rhododendron molle TaxID=49168 RepID=A0ACC0PXC0_RHOML|nr:hypothetical protein RHMOL_Rhmol01G0018500 [Rhododendron molle]